MALNSLDGKVALVTGSSRGIGRAIAESLAGHGADVAVNYRERSDLANEVVRAIEGMGRRAIAVKADVGDSDEALELFGEIVESLGGLDILVNNAGINLPGRGMEETTVESWNTIVGLNLTGAFLCARAVLPVMRSQGYGTIVNVASWSGKRAMLRTGPAYCASKAGLLSLNESINLAERPRGIRSCVICPGEVETEALDRRPKPVSAAARATMMQSEDLAAAVVFVATLPQRATVEEMVIRPTILRNPGDDPRHETGVDPTAAR